MSDIDAFRNGIGGIVAPVDVELAGVGIIQIYAQFAFNRPFGFKGFGGTSTVRTADISASDALFIGCAGICAFISDKAVTESVAFAWC